MRLRLWGVAAIAAACVTGLLTSLAAPATADPGRIIAPYMSTTVVGAGVPTFGGISGIDRIGSGNYALIAADPAPARFFTTQVGFSARSTNFSGWGLTGGGTVFGPGNVPVLPGGAHFTGIRQLGGNYVVTSRGPQQFIRVIGGIGNHIRDLPLPGPYRPTRTTGLTPDRGFGGVAVGPQGQISAITKGGLRQNSSTAARLLVYPNARSGAAGARDYLYRTDGDKKVADVIAINSTDYLVLERGPGRSTAIYWTTIGGADTIGGELTPQQRPLVKRPVFSSSNVPRLNTGNMSGMAWGNWLPDRARQDYRARTLYVVTADTPTRLHALEVRFPRR